MESNKGDALAGLLTEKEGMNDRYENMENPEDSKECCHIINKFMKKNCFNEELLLYRIYEENLLHMSFRASKLEHLIICDKVSH